MPIKPMTRKQHVAAGGDKCPFCRSRRIEAVHAPNVLFGEATQGIECCDCGKRWLDVYKLVRYEKLEDK